MAKAKQLPSGNWRVLVYAGKDASGKRKYESFTAETAKEAEYMALEYVLKNKSKPKTRSMTVGEAIDEYIENRNAVLSPTTIYNYKVCRRQHLQDIMGVQLKVLTQDKIQKAVNADAKRISAKSVRNAHGLLSATLKEYLPSFALTTVLPKKQKPKILIPEEEDIVKLLQASEGTLLKIPLLLAVTFGFRRSELCGLRWKDIDFKANTISITGAKVYAGKGEVYKAPKSYSGTRTIPMPEFIKTTLKDEKASRPEDTEDSFVAGTTGGRVYKMFVDLQKKLNIPRFRFHDLRHYNASVMLSLNVPNKYAAERMGHATEDMLKSVYQHIISKKMNEENTKVNNYFETLCNTKSNNDSGKC